MEWSSRKLVALVLLVSMAVFEVALPVAAETSPYSGATMNERAEFASFKPKAVPRSGMPQISSVPSYVGVDPDGIMTSITGVSTADRIEGVSKKGTIPSDLPVALEALSSAYKHRSRFLNKQGLDTAAAGHITAMTYPLTAIGCFRLSAVATFCCTAFRVGRGTNIAITAGHCVYDQTTKKIQDFTNVAFVPSYDATLGPHPPQPIPITKYYFDMRFYNPSLDWRHDWAILVLGSPLTPESTGTFGLKVHPPFPVAITLAGYPSNHPGEMWKDSCSMIADAEPLKGSYAPCFSFGGMSGAPVYMNDNYAVAIHAWGAPGRGAWLVADFFIGFVNEAIRTAGVIAGAVPVP